MSKRHSILLTKACFFISSVGKTESVHEFKIKLFQQLFYFKLQMNYATNLSTKVIVSSQLYFFPFSSLKHVVEFRTITAAKNLRILQVQKKRSKLKTTDQKRNIIAVLKNLNQIIKRLHQFGCIKPAVIVALHSHSILFQLTLMKKKTPALTLELCSSALFM